VVIKASDRLIEVLARDERVLEVILATTPSLKGLRNPVTRKVMGRLATVEQVARMAGLEPDLLVRRINAALAGEGSGTREPKPATAAAAPDREPEPPEISKQESEMIDTGASLPAHLAGLAPERLFDLDVREDLRNGREPFSHIMAAKAALPEGGVLRLRATFEPVPLYAVLGKQGFDHWTERLAEDDWRVWFYPRGMADVADAASTASAPGGADAAGSAPPRSASAGEATPTSAEADNDLVILDVRGLEPPEPMVRTLAALETLGAGQTLLQINARIPHFLLPRLDKLGYAYDIREQAEGIVRVFIRRRDAE